MIAFCRFLVLRDFSHLLYRELVMMIMVVGLFPEHCLGTSMVFSFEKVLPCALGGRYYYYPILEI